MDAPLSAPRAAHMSASFARSHTELSSVLGTQVGLHQPKVRGRGKGKTKGEKWLCVWVSGIIRGALKRPLDSCVESVKTCPKTSESEVCRSSDMKGAPSDAMSVGGGDPLPSSSGELHEFVRGRVVGEH